MDNEKTKAVFDQAFELVFFFSREGTGGDDFQRVCIGLLERLEELDEDRYHEMFQKGLDSTR